MMKFRDGDHSDAVRVAAALVVVRVANGRHERRHSSKAKAAGRVRQGASARNKDTLRAEHMRVQREALCEVIALLDEMI